MGHGILALALNSAIKTIRFLSVTSYCLYCLLPPISTSSTEGSLPWTQPEEEEEEDEDADTWDPLVSERGRELSRLTMSSARDKTVISRCF
jgi:hypothetical protein